MLSEKVIQAKINALIEQRNGANDAYVNLVGSYAQLLEENEQLKAQVEKLSTFEGAEIVTAEEVENG